MIWVTSGINENQNQTKRADNMYRSCVILHKPGHIYHIVKRVSENSNSEDVQNPNPSIKKLNNLEIYIVLPSKITKSNELDLDTCYENVSTLTNNFVSNLSNFGNFIVGTPQGITLPGINTVYVPCGNCFTIPILNTTALKFGAVERASSNVICHGFDLVNGAHIIIIESIADIGGNTASYYAYA